jgi:cytochrome c biogenesis protein CcmG, thiol:disulfide interchange protein DsbE
MRRVVALLAGIGLVVALVIGLTQASKDSGQAEDLPPFHLNTTKQRLAQAPPPLNGLYAQANELLPGGTKALDKRLAELKGHPVVINKWASWCVPCQGEFPIFQYVAGKRGKRIAFLGIDAHDVDAAADKFLAKRPLPYPSYTDPKDIIATDRHIAVGYPMTQFLDRQGKQAFLHTGTYHSAAELTADIDRYLR